MAVRTAAERRTPVFLRIALVLQTLSLLFQAVTAAVLLSSSHGAPLHDAGSRVMYAASMLYVLAAVLAWRPGGGPVRPVLHACGFLVLASLQVVTGIAQLPGLHVPLGVLMLVLSVLDLARPPSPGRAGTSPDRTGRGAGSARRGDLASGA
ncbi:hypothetical protein [Streptomyces sp. NPDC012888]|uniref:hypothetical protein n=1 Tax=Streptomyces sp. NPDC012888 TaxID=3364855 RepID=UPI0036ACF3EC